MNNLLSASKKPILEFHSRSSPLKQPDTVAIAQGAKEETKKPSKINLAFNSSYMVKCYVPSANDEQPGNQSDERLKSRGHSSSSASSKNGNRRQLHHHRQKRFMTTMMTRQTSTQTQKLSDKQQDNAKRAIATSTMTMMPIQQLHNQSTPVSAFQSFRNSAQKGSPVYEAKILPQVNENSGRELENQPQRGGVRGHQRGKSWLRKNNREDLRHGGASQPSISSFDESKSFMKKLSPQKQESATKSEFMTTLDFPARSRLRGDQKLEMKQFRANLIKYKYSSQESNGAYVLGNKSQNLGAKIPLLGADLAYSIHQFAKQVHSQTTLLENVQDVPQRNAQVNFNHGSWRNKSLEVNRAQTFDSKSTYTYAKQFNHLRERAKGLVMHRVNSSGRAEFSMQQQSEPSLRSRDQNTSSMPDYPLTTQATSQFQTTQKNFRTIGGGDQVAQEKMGGNMTTSCMQSLDSEEFHNKHDNIEPMNFTTNNESSYQQHQSQQRFYRKRVSASELSSQKKNSSIFLSSTVGQSRIPNKKAEALNMEKLNQTFTTFQSLDQYQKEKDVSIGRKADHQPMADGPWSLQKVNKELVLNPKVSIKAHTKLKPQERKAFDSTYLGRLHQRELTKKQQIKDIAHQQFEAQKEHASDPLEDFMMSIKKTQKPKMKDYQAKDAENSALEKLKKHLKDLSIQSQTKRINNSQIMLADEIRKVIQVLEFKDKDEIYSDSDASEQRYEEVQVHLDNQISSQIKTSFHKKEGQVEDFDRKGTNKKVRKQKLQNDIIKYYLEELENTTDQFMTDAAQASAKRRKTIVRMLEGMDEPHRYKLESDKKLGALNKELGQSLSNISSIVKAIYNEDSKLGNISDRVTEDVVMRTMTLDNNLKFQRANTLRGGAMNFTPGSRVVKRDGNKVKAQQIVKQMKFNEIGKQAHRETFQLLLQNDPMLVYQQTVHQTREIQLPLINKIIDRRLVLIDYTLDSGHLQGLTDSIEKTKKPHINELLFDNCGIDDQELSLLLNGLTNLQTFDVFAYKNNVFLEHGLAALKQILLQPDPYNLHELRLVSCNTTSKITGSLVNFLVLSRCHLRSLSLVQMQVNKVSLARLANYVENSEYLEDLDVSWNDLLPIDFVPLFNVLSNNKTLVRLNLSCNFIIDKLDQNNPVDLRNKSAMDQYVEMRQQAIKAGSAKIENPEAQEDHPIVVCTSIGRLIRYNRRIQSINLRNTGLNSQVLCGLVPYLRHAKSLVCLHLGANPGINEQVRQYFCERLKIQPCTKLNIEIEKEIIAPLTPEELQSMSQQEIEVRRYKIKHFAEWKNEETAKYLHNKRLRPLLNKQEVKLYTEANNLLLSRILGHKARMKDSGRWLMQTQMETDGCWTCDRWGFTLFFWNEKVGIYNDINKIGVSSETMEGIVDMIRVQSPDTYMNHEDVPVLFQNNTDWKPKPFLRLIDFLNSVEPQDEPKYVEQSLLDAKDEFNFEEFNQLPKKLKVEVQEYMDARKKALRHEYVKMRLSNTRRIMTNNLRYKKPTMLNIDHLDFEDENMWCLPLFLKPGKNDFIVRTRRDEQIQQQIDDGDFIDLLDYQIEQDAMYRFYYVREVIDVRQENVPNFTKELKINTDAQKFMRKISVFKDWKEDTKKMIGESLNHDLRYWKIKRLAGTFDMYSRVEVIIRQNFLVLKEIFISACARMGGPDLTRKCFQRFVEYAGILDNNLIQGIVDTLFKATNFEEQEQDNNQDNALCRFEFLEILVRLAQAKYIDYGTEKSLATALQKLIQNFILPVKKNFTPWHEWRVNELWCNEVNDMLEVNIRAIRKLYDFIAKQKFIKMRNRIDVVNYSFASIDQIRQVFTEHAIPGLPDFHVVQAFYLCKYTVPQENEMANYEYTYLHWPEFIEFVGRLAQLKYQGTPEDEQWPLKKKIGIVLTFLFKIIGERRVNPPDLVEVISESDDDY